MTSLKNRLKLSFLVSVHNSVFRLNEWACSSNFIRKISNNSFYRAIVNFFKNSCNAVAKFLGFNPIFKVKNNNSNIINRGVQYIANETQNYQDWNKVVYILELLKLKLTKATSNSIGLWYKTVSNKNSSLESMRALKSRLDRMPISKLKRTTDALYSLSKSTENVLNYFDSLNNQQSGILDSALNNISRLQPPCIAKGHFDSEINTTINNIREKHNLIKEEISLCDRTLLERQDNININDLSRNPSSSSFNLSFS